MTGKMVRATRKELSLSLERFARLLDVSFVSLSRWEHLGDKELSRFGNFVMAEFLATKYDDLLAQQKKGEKK